MKISVLIGTRNRTTPLLRCLDSVAAQRQAPHEVIVLDDASDRVSVAELLRRHGSDARVIRSDTQLGVGRGRNLLYRHATGDAFLVLDDDAYLEDEGFLERVSAELTRVPAAAILATRIVEHRAGGAVLLVPFPRATRRRDPAVTDRAQLVSYFLGGGHVYRRAAYERVGGYDDALVWGEEELDLSFRVIDAGYEIHYVPALTVVHAPEPQVLRSSAQRASELTHHVRNRFLLARKYLPWYYAAPYLATWLMRHAADAARTGDVSGFVQGVADGLALRRRTPPGLLGAAARRYLRHNHGRTWY